MPLPYISVVVVAGRGPRPGSARRRESARADRLDRALTTGMRSNPPYHEHRASTPGHGCNGEIAAGVCRDHHSKSAAARSASFAAAPRKRGRIAVCCVLLIARAGGRRRHAAPGRRAFNVSRHPHRVGAPNSSWRFGRRRSPSINSTAVYTPPQRQRDVARSRLPSRTALTIISALTPRAACA